MSLSLSSLLYTQLFEFLGAEGFEMISILLQRRSDIVDSLLSVPTDSRHNYPPGELCCGSITISHPTIRLSWWSLENCLYIWQYCLEVMIWPYNLIANCKIGSQPLSQEMAQRCTHKKLACIRWGHGENAKVGMPAFEVIWHCKYEVLTLDLIIAAHM